VNIILNGLHRSGTTLLSRLINALPGTFIIKDGLRLPYYYLRVEITEGKPEDLIRYPYGMYGGSGMVFDLNREVRDISALREILRKEVTAYSLEAGLEESMMLWLGRLDQGFSYHDVLTGLFENIRSGSSGTGDQSVGVKCTHMVSFAQDMLIAFPDMKWIEIIRDPRGWYCSSRVSHSQKLLRGLRLWNSEVTASIEAARQFPDRFLVITYEDLILNYATTFQLICAFLDCDCTVTDEWIKDLELVENDGRKWYVNASYVKNGGMIPEAQNKRILSDYETFDPHPVFRWKGLLPFRVKMLITLLTLRNRNRLTSFTSGTAADQE